MPLGISDRNNTIVAIVFLLRQRLGTAKRCQFSVISYFLVDVSSDDFSVLFQHLYKILIASLRPCCSKHI